MAANSHRVTCASLFLLKNMSAVPKPNPPDHTVVNTNL
jgi:hypothetical protein